MPARLMADNAPLAADTFGVSNDGITRVIIAEAGTSYIWLDERDGLHGLKLDGLTVKQTADGFATLTALAAPLPRAHLNACLRTRTGVFLVGLDALAATGVQVARSADGGASWSTVTVDPTVAGFSRVCPGSFVECDDGSVLVHRDPNAGAHDHVRVYRSTDDGATWAMVLDPLEANAATQGSLAYIRGRAFLVSGDNVHNLIVHRSVDEGVTWEVTLDAGPRRLFDANFKCRNRICLRPDGTRLYVYTRANPGGQRYVSPDGAGSSWTLEADPFGVQAIHGIQASAQRLWAVRDIAGLTLLQSADDGATWTNLGSIRGGATNAAGVFATHQVAAGAPPVGILAAFTGRPSLGGRRPQRGTEIEREPRPGDDEEAPDV